jgi:hypothetical protein
MGQISQSSLYKVVDRNIQIPFYGNLNTKVKQMVPNGSGLIDVVNKFKWKNYGSADEVPSILLEEFELSYGTWVNNIARILQGISNLTSGNLTDPYLALYVVDPNQNRFRYNLPLLLGNGAKIRNVQHNWGPLQGGIDQMLDLGKENGILDTIGRFTGALAGALTPTTGKGYEDIYQYNNTNLESLTITFPLYNTGTTTEAYQNYSFCNLITFQNLKTRTSYLTFIPPKIYSVSTNALGGVYWPAAIVQNLSIESIGTTRALDEFGGGRILIPEAYKVSITLQQLVPNSSNIFEGAIGGRKVDVFINRDDVGQALNNIATELNSRFNPSSTTSNSQNNNP